MVFHISFLIFEVIKKMLLKYFVKLIEGKWTVYAHKNVQCAEWVPLNFIKFLFLLIMSSFVYFTAYILVVNIDKIDNEINSYYYRNYGKRNAQTPYPTNFLYYILVKWAVWLKPFYFIDFSHYPYRKFLHRNALTKSNV